MKHTLVSEWLDRIFYNVDYEVLKYLHHIAEKTDGALTEAFSLFCLLSDKGILLLLGAIVLFYFPKMRKTSLYLAGSICCSAFLTLVLKKWISRPRPFVNIHEDFYQWWLFMGAPAETGFAFPSGHTAVAMAAATAIFFSLNKKFSWTAYLFVLLTAIARCYLQVHYPSDILGAILIGFFSTLVMIQVYPLVWRILTALFPVGRES